MMFSPANTTGDSARLEDYLRAIAARRWVVVAATAIGLVLATVLAQGRTATYTATATVVLGPTPVGSVNQNLVNPNLEKEREIVLSNSTAQAVADAFGGQFDVDVLLENVAVAFRPDSDVLSVDYTAEDPDEAAAVANAFADSYVTARESAAVDYYASRISVADDELVSLRQSSSDLAADIEALNRDRTVIVTTLVGEDRTAPLAEVDDQLASLRAQRSDVASQIRTTENSRRQDEATLASRSPSAALLRSATAPGAPDGIPTRLLQAAGFSLGLLFGVVTAFLLERLDTTARDDDDVALALGTTVVGSIPSLGFRNRSGAAALVMLDNSGSSARISSARESFRRLRTSLQFLSSADEIRSVIVTSATPSEGKSVVSANLAIALAQSGQRVALLSADLRRPTQEERFGIEQSGGGLSDYLGNASDVKIVDVPAVPGLWILPAGPAPANPGELLGSARFEALLDELRDEVDFVIIDTPPILSTADAVIAARAADGVLVVVDSSRTESTELLQVRSDLTTTGARLVGAVLNKRRFRRGGLFKRDRYAYYSSSAAPDLPAATAPPSLEKSTAK